MAVTVREATTDDAAAACDVIRRSIVELCRLDYGTDEALLARWLANKTVENVQRWISQSRHFLVAEEGGMVLGAASMTNAGKVLLNYVSPDARFRGVSKALMRTLEDRARAVGIAECSLDSTQTALALYQSLGYERTDQNYTHPVTCAPALVLAKRLQPADPSR
jgi:N-acetylglutamate synthase-like GNAT family acetyltransferase